MSSISTTSTPPGTTSRKLNNVKITTTTNSASSSSSATKSAQSRPLLKTTTVPSTTTSTATPRSSSHQLRTDLRAAFSVFDTNNSGSISTSEFIAVIRMLGYQVTDSELNEMVQELDSNSDGHISFDEFSALMTRRNGGGHTSEIDPVNDALRIFDSGNPSLCRMDIKELHHICVLLKENLSEEEMNAIVKELGPDPVDGTFNYAKLVAQMMPG